MTEDNTDYDYALALQLYESLNGAPFTASPQDFAVTASDSEEDEQDHKFAISANLSLPVAHNDITMATSANTSTVTFDNQQAITVSCEFIAQQDITVNAHNFAITTTDPI